MGLDWSHTVWMSRCSWHYHNAVYSEVSLSETLNMTKYIILRWRCEIKSGLLVLASMQHTGWYFILHNFFYIQYGGVCFVAAFLSDVFSPVQNKVSCLGCFCRPCLGFFIECSESLQSCSWLFNVHFVFQGSGNHFIRGHIWTSWGQDPKCAPQIILWGPTPKVISLMSKLLSHSTV